MRIDIPKGGYAPTFPPSSRWLGASSHRRPPPRAGAARRTVGWGWPRWRSRACSFSSRCGPQAPTAEAEGGRATPQERRPAIVVIPLEDLSEGHSGEVFAGGLTEELASNLMRSGEFRLYSIYGRSLKEPTAEPVALSDRLDVGYMIKGSIRGRPDRIRLIVHLIDAQTGQFVWTETYDRALTPEHVLAVQEQLAADVAGQLAHHTASSRR